jgi:hypothetical protein
VGPLPQQSLSSLYLEFATVYQCGVKPFKAVAQNRAVCILLPVKVDNGPLPLSDAVCSNYINGKRAIPDNYRTVLANTTENDIKKKFEDLGIYELQLPAEALRQLVAHATLPAATRGKLIKSYQNSTDTSTPEKFLADVFCCSVNTKGSHPLTPENLTQLSTYSTFKISEASEGSGEDGADSDSDLSEEDQKWMRNYIPQKLPLTSRSFFGASVTMDLQPLNLPRDLTPLVYLLKPVFKEVQVEMFTFDEFLDCTGINPITGNLQSGTLRYLKILGPIDGVVGAIHNISFKDVCSVVLLARGQITIQDMDRIEQAVKDASLSTIRFIRSLIFDKQFSDVEAILITMADPKQAQKMRDDFAEQDRDIRIASFPNTDEPPQ